MQKTITKKVRHLFSLSIITLGLITTSASAFASDISTDALNKINSLHDSPQSFAKALGLLEDKSFLTTFNASVDALENNRFKESIDKLLDIQKEFPQAPYIIWRLSRGYWTYAENMDINDKENRLVNFEIGLDWAKKGIEINPECGQCYMFKFANLGRIGTTKGILSQISTAEELSDTIAKTIKLAPQHRDTEFNYALANAYYGSGVFYRIVPDWLILKWIAGVRGDKFKALEHIKKASELTPQRIDYQVELGAVYLCLANEKGKEELREKGNEVLRHAIGMNEVMPTDALDKEYAQGFLEDSKGACGFSRDGIVDLEKDKEKLEKK